MKNFLAIDTSGDYLCVAARKDGEIFSIFEPDCAMKHSTLLLAKIDELLKKAQMKLEDCDFFAACVGAGSFTGIRIGISVAKGFAVACKKPTLSITSFDIAAYNTISALGENKKKTLALVDAMHGYYYACGYENGCVCLPPCYISQEQVLALKAEGYSLVSCKISPIFEQTQVELVSPEKGLCGAVAVKAETAQFDDLQALYVRKSSAEENLAAKSE